MLYLLTASIVQPPQHPVQGLKFLDRHIKQIANRSKTRNPANKHKAGAWVPPSLVRCLASFARINTCAHGHAIKRTPQQLHLTHVAIVNTPDMRDHAFRPFVSIMAGSCDDLQMKFSSMAGGTSLYRPGSTAVFAPRIEVRGEIALKVFNMKTSGVPKSQFVLNMHGDTLQLDTSSPPLSASTAVAPASASNQPAKVMTIVRCLKRHIDGVEFDERFDDGFAVEFAFTHLTDVKDSGDNAEESERDIRDGGLRALYPESITRIKCDRVTCGQIFVYPPATTAASASSSRGRVQCPKCKTMMCVPFLLSGSHQRSRPIPSRREVVLEESHPLARSAPQPRRAMSHNSRLRSMSLTDNMGRPRVPPPPAVETFTPDNESDIRVGARVRALWLGQDRQRWPDWYLATVTAAHADGSFSLMYDDGYRGFGVPRTAIRCSVEHHIELLREMFPAVPFSVLKQRVTEANAQGLTQEQLVDVVMRINEAYNSQSRAHAADAATAAVAGASDSAEASYRPASQADLRAGNALMTPVGVGTMLQFRPRDGIVIVKLPWSVVCVHIDQVRVQERPENARSTMASNSAAPAAASSQRAQQILLDEILARELSIDSDGNIPQSPEIFTDHVVGPEDSRIGAAEITEIVNLPTFKFSIQTSSCVQTSNMMCTVCQCDFEEGELLRTLPCNHVYHVECIDPWLRMKKVCPICNTPIDKPRALLKAER